MPLLDLSPRLDRAVTVARSVPSFEVRTTARGEGREVNVVARVGRDVLELGDVGGWGRYRYVARPGRVEGYDLRLRERLSRPSSRKGFDALVYSTGALPDPVRYAADPAALAAFLKPFRGRREWHSDDGGFVTTIAGSEVRLAFSADGLLSRASLSRAGRRLAWTVAPVGLEPLVAAGYRSVGRFAPLPPKPTGDEAAREGLLRAMRAWRGLNDMRVTVSSGSVIDLRGGSVAERRGGAAWSYDGANLVATDGRSWWRGRTGPLRVGPLVAELLKFRPHPLALARATGAAPLAELLPAGARARSVGEVSLRGKPLRILEIEDGRTRVSVALSPLDGRVASTTAPASDPVRYAYAAGGNVTLPRSPRGYLALPSPKMNR